jgi:hypothetical protein
MKTSELAGVVGGTILAYIAIVALYIGGLLAIGYFIALPVLRYAYQFITG